MKETKEAMVLGGQLTNTIYEVAEDGKVNLEDLARVFPLILNAQKGVEGFGLIGVEQDTIGPAEKENIRASVVASMPSAGTADADDWADVLQGILSGYRLGRRAGKKQAEEAILKELKEKGAAYVISSLEVS